MPVSLDDIIAGMSPDQRQRIDRLTAEFEREELAWLKSPRERFELYKDKAGEFRFRLVAANGALLMSSEGFSTKDLALKAIETIRRSADDAEFIDAAA